MVAINCRDFRSGLRCFLMASFVMTASLDVVAADLIYLNRCAAGCTVQAGVDNAINHVSSIPASTRSLPAFPYGDAPLAATASCLRQVFSRYDVTVTTVDPGALPRREIMLAGLSQNLGLPAGIEAIAPVYPQPRDNAIVFVFAEQLLGDVDGMCWLAAQQVGFLYTLDYELHCPDLMSTSRGCGVKTFSDFTAQCGETSPRTCLSGGATQNSAAILGIVPGLGDRLFLSEFERAAPTP